ncbi:hypothetical protein AXF42_Ash016544 [Apostasia shenzhenica]|uniref:Uncharacterized protein n=1 Tax=Apostasia shenzhenica TaxID=1088818 RepID=A0A2I0AVE9_9ASPA|nr:hypothetical protein AXF42_Ash016544 [Apostasia shenzhenica]
MRVQPSLVHDEPGPFLYKTLFPDPSSGGQQTMRTQSLSTSFSPENQDKAAPSAAYKYL